MPAVITYDTENRYSWSEFSVNDYNGDGQFVDTGYLYDNGTAYVEIVQFGLLARTITFDVQEDGGFFSWLEKHEIFDSAGDFIGTGTLMDNGVYFGTQLNADGVVTSTNVYDSENIYDWTGKSVTFGDPIGASYYTFDYWTYDDGRTIEDTLYLDDTRISVETDRYDNYAWATREKRYIDGLIYESVVTNDNGVEVLSRISPEGQTYRKVTSDTADIFAWDSKTLDFGQNGQVQGNAITFDDGRFHYTVYNGGQRVTTFQEDTLDVKNWDSIQTHFDTYGNKSVKLTTYDNGIVRAEQWDGGLRTQTSVEDTADIKSWATHTTIFDPVTGQLGGIAIVFDDGTERDTVYRGGVRTIEETRDAADAFAWQTKLAFFAPDGIRLSTETRMDNGDKIIFAFQEDDGQRDYRIEVDGDNSELWAYRVTEYDVDGVNPIVTTYNTITDLPSPYIDQLGFAEI